MNLEPILNALQNRCDAAGQSVEIYEIPIDETVVKLQPQCIRQAVQVIVSQFNLYHLSTITGQDTGQEIELLYHFWDGCGLTLHTLLPRQQAHIATITDLIPGALLYEREVSEMLHVDFEGHPGLQALLLPDDWNEPAPLRKENASASSLEESK